jgi:uncharacterized membrane protein
MATAPTKAACRCAGGRQVSKPVQSGMDVWFRHSQLAADMLGIKAQPLAGSPQQSPATHQASILSLLFLCAVMQDPTTRGSGSHLHELEKVT